MILKSLILGVIFSVGIFAVKSGVGMAYVLAGRSRRRDRAVALLAFAAAYAVLFTLVAVLVAKLNPLEHLSAIQAFMQSGMVIHLAMAALMMVWGVFLLKGDDGHAGNSRAWLLLALPCPVCATVIFFSAGFLLAAFPDFPVLAPSALFAVYLIVSLAAVGVAGLHEKHAEGPRESLLGGAMMLIALYFFLSVTVLPQFADMEKIYRLAVYQGREQARELPHLALFVTLTAAAFLSGIGYRVNRTRSFK